MPLNSVAALASAPKWMAEWRKQQSVSNTFGGSWWKSGIATQIPPPGATPATAGAGGTSYSRLSDSGAALAIPSGDLRLAAFRASLDSTQEATVMLVDRLVACSGLVLNSLSPQTVTLPALPRFTDGKGVIPVLELYVAAANSASSHTLTYTNSDGTASRTSGMLVDPYSSSTNNNANTTRMFGLQPPDQGVRTVTAYTISAGSHAAPGDVGITLVRPIAIFSIGSSADSAYKPKMRDWLDTCLAEIPSDACLTLMTLSSVLSTATVLKMKLELLSAA